MRFLLLLFLTCFFAHSAAGAERPNIILIMVDDKGFSDLGHFGSELHNLAATHPEKRDELIAIWDIWSLKNGVLPKQVRKKQADR